MSDFVKIGKKFINLELVTHVTHDVEDRQPCLYVWFSWNGMGSDAYTVVTGRDNINELTEHLEMRQGKEQKSLPVPQRGMF